MKKRVKIDVTLMSLAVLVSVILFQFPKLYLGNPMDDDIGDFIGLFIVLIGTFLRMAARGYKKVNSKSGHGLVTTGPYSLVRNPMYLGSFMMGMGFIMIIWPLWMLPVFGTLFYLRFRRQVLIEEKMLLSHFGKTYEVYMKRVPRALPNSSSFKTSLREAFPWQVAWNTKEKMGLVGWPVGAFIMELLQEKMVYGILDVEKVFYLIASSVVVFGIFLWFVYKAR